ncbi:hypothetical protein FOHLNKBM_3858 [Methylobacterium longum]|jgi:hypothetical protein|nr:hypothetical protein FOHLNKBM_3858 [Methylobacterium longum]
MRRLNRFFGSVALTTLRLIPAAALAEEGGPCSARSI